MTKHALALAALLSLSSTTATAKTLRGTPKYLQIDNTRGIDYPAFRYVPWCMLDEKTQVRAQDLSCKFFYVVLATRTGYGTVSAVPKLTNPLR